MIFGTHFTHLEDPGITWVVFHYRLNLKSSNPPTNPQDAKKGENLYSLYTRMIIYDIFFRLDRESRKYFSKAIMDETSEPASLGVK